MPSQENLKLMQKLADHAKKWLVEEDSFLRQFERALEKHDFGKATCFAGRYQQYYTETKQYHLRFLNAVGTLGLEGLADAYQQRITVLRRKIISVEEQADKEQQEFNTLLRERDWTGLKSLVPQVRETIKQWITLDMQLIGFEIQVYEEDKKAAGILRKVIRQLEKNPSSITDERTQERVREAAQNPQTAALFRTRMRLLWKTVSVTSKTAVWYFLIWGYLQYGLPLLKPTTRHQTIREVGVMLNRPEFIQEWLDSLSEEQKRILLHDYLKEQRTIVEQELQGLLQQVAADIYQQILHQMYQNYTPLRNRMDAMAREDPAIKVKNTFASQAAMEKELLSQLGTTREKLTADIYTHLRQYYVVDLLEPRLPTPGNLLQHLSQRRFKDAWEDLKWGAAEPTFKIKMEDDIRKDLNTALEPFVNELKQKIAGAIFGGNVWKEVENTISTLFHEPSKAEQALKNLYSSLKDMGLGWLVVLIILMLTGTAGITFKFAKIFIWNYLRDVLILIKFGARRIIKTKK